MRPSVQSVSKMQNADRNFWSPIETNWAQTPRETSRHWSQNAVPDGDRIIYFGLKS